MDLVDKLRQEASSGHVAYTEFILKLKKRSDCLFCFFEGKDDYKYYGIRIESTTKRDFEVIDCGGKEHVIAVKDLLSSKKEYRNILKGFFIDQDYDEYKSFKNIYCLPSYSIENQYSQLHVLQKILKNEFSLQEDDEDFQKVCNLFGNLQEEFHNKTKLINAWLACQNDKRNLSKTKTYLRIDTTIGHFFNSIVNENLELEFDFSGLDSLDKIQAFFPLAPIITQQEIDDKLNYFSSKNLNQVFRGKFELKFLINFLDKLKSEICKKKPHLFNKKHKCNLRFEYSNGLTNLSIYANTPGCLYIYLENLTKKAA